MRCKIFNRGLFYFLGATGYQLGPLGGVQGISHGPGIGNCPISHCLSGNLGFLKMNSPNIWSWTPSRGHQAASYSGLGVRSRLCSRRKEPRELGIRAHVRVYVFLPRSLLRGFPQSCLPHAARRGAAHRSAIQGLSELALSPPSTSPFSLPHWVYLPSLRTRRTTRGHVRNYSPG